MEKEKERKENELRPKLGKYYLLVLSVIIMLILIIYFVILKVDPTKYLTYLRNLHADSQNKTLMDLNNANTVSNLPNITLQTNNSDIDNLTNCKNNLKYLGPIDETKFESYRSVCKLSCGGSGELLIIEGPKDYIINNVFVNPGVYCTVDPPPCNTNTGYIIATANSTTCRSKYPRMFGGPNATDIVACNNQKHPSTGSILWDYANNEPVQPALVNMLNEDELLDDGSYRFRCKFKETKMENPYISHPIDRLHPIEDVCNKTIYRADYSVHADVDDKGWSCDCGDFTTTRVSHLDKSDPKSTCTSCFYDKKNNIYTIPYLCFNENSTFTLPKNYLPCIEYKSKGSACEKLVLEATNPPTEDKFVFTTPETIELEDSVLTTSYIVNEHKPI